MLIFVHSLLGNWARLVVSPVRGIFVLSYFYCFEGLDPAEPCFKDNGLNTTDALYVDVIHTNTAIFGRSAIIGVKDFYPNGGKFMPGCVLRGDLFLDKLNIVKRRHDFF